MARILTIAAGRHLRSRSGAAIVWAGGVAMGRWGGGAVGVNNESQVLMVSVYGYVM